MIWSCSLTLCAIYKFYRRSVTTRTDEQKLQHYTRISRMFTRWGNLSSSSLEVYLIKTFYSHNIWHHCNEVVMWIIFSMLSFLENSHERVVKIDQSLHSDSKFCLRHYRFFVRFFFMPIFSFLWIHFSIFHFLGIYQLLDLQTLDYVAMNLVSSMMRKLNKIVCKVPKKFFFIKIK